MTQPRTLISGLSAGDYSAIGLTAGAEIPDDPELDI